MVIAPTIGWRFPATENPRSVWIDIWILLIKMMLTGESNEPLEGCLGQNAELTPPVEKRSQLTLSAQWSLEEPLDEGLKAPLTASFW